DDIAAQAIGPARRTIAQRRLPERAVQLMDPSFAVVCCEDVPLELAWSVRPLLRVAARDGLRTDKQQSTATPCLGITVCVALGVGAVCHRERSRDRGDGSKDWPQAQRGRSVTPRPGVFEPGAGLRQYRSERRVQRGLCADGLRRLRRGCCLLHISVLLLDRVGPFFP